MSFQDESRLIEELERSTVALKQTLTGMADNAARTRRADGGWCPLELAEHILIVDGRIRSAVAGGTLLDAPQFNPEREKALAHRMLSREEKRVAPEPSCPHGKFSTIPEAIAALDDNLQTNREFVTKNASNLRRLEVDHPRMGKFSGYEAVLLMSNHARRHVAQIEEMQSAAQAPTQAEQ